MSELELGSRSSWLSREDLDAARDRMPVLYVHAIPVRVDHAGAVTSVGLLLRAGDHGTIARELIAGRVFHGERIRDAVLRHIEKDLGPMALPLVPVSPTPFTVAEFFPTPGVTAYHDPRQHAVSLAYIVPVSGDCSPQADALDLAWVTPEETSDPALLADMAPGHGALLRHALVHLGFDV